MPKENDQRPPRFIPRLSLDTWAVLIALFLAVLIRAGAIPHVPW
jgi:hypothetical protein